MKLSGLCILMCVFKLWAADSTDTRVSAPPLTIYSGGIGIGVMSALNKEFREEAGALVRIAFLNDVYLVDRLHLFADADWQGPSSNLGLEVGVNLMSAFSRFRWFAGIGMGARSFDWNGGTLARNIAPSGTLRAGFILEATESLQLRVQLPYIIIFNDTYDQELGVELGLLFSAPYRHIKKLNY